MHLLLVDTQTLHLYTLMHPNYVNKVAKIYVAAFAAVLDYIRLYRCTL